LSAVWDEVEATVRRLRAPGGCPWDREQTHRSLRTYVLEEAREVVEAIDSGDMHALAEELGDLLLQVLLHSVIAEERGAFRLEDVLRGLNAKLIRRHPHVFADAVALTPAQGLAQWDAIKAAERRQAAAEGRGSAVDAGGQPQAEPGVLDRVPRSLPGLVEAQRLGAAAARVGFDWGSPQAAWPKVQEECRELDEALGSGDADAAEAELGDLLFAVVNVARLRGLDAEVALLGTNTRFRHRFAAVEAAARGSGRMVADMALAEMNAAWESAKGARAAGPSEAAAAPRDTDA
jgi:tetrapyrrole methylase family protein/MazG family protein